jgi:hypothetical protein
METTEYSIQEIKRKVFKCVTKNLRKNSQYLVIIASDFKPIGVTICINANFLDEYSKSKWKKRRFRRSGKNDNLILNFE